MSSAIVKDKNLNGRFGPKRGAIKATTAKKKTGTFHKVLVFIGLREEEEEVISEAEKMRRYAIAMAGWKKVKKTLTVIRYRGADMFQSSALPTKRASIMSYSNFVIPPNSRFGFLWRTIKALLVTYNLIIVPYRVSFGNFSHSLIVVDYYMDGFFVADIFVNFLSAFNRRTKVVKDFKSIAIHYVFTQLWIDLISIFPYYWTTPVDKYYFLRYFRFLQIFKANEQLKTFCESVLLHLTANITVVKSLSRILNFVIFLAIIGNLLASIWYSLGQKMNVQVGQHTDFKISGWINDLGSNSPQVTLYIASLYWTFTTLTTVGYGDIVGHTTEEYMYTMVVEFIGVFLFAYLMSNINNLIQKLESGNVEILENKTEELDQWILKIDRANRDRKLPTDLVDEVKFFFRNYWQKDHTTIQNDEAFLNQMPRDLRSKLIKHLFSKFIDRFGVFFDGLEEAFADEIVINLVPRKFTKNTDIVKIDHGAKYVYFILKGRVTVCSQDAVDEYLTLENNTYFGEHLIFFKLKSSNAFRACDEEVECMCLPKAKFVELCQEFPASAKILKYKAYLRRKHYRKAKLEVQLAHEKKLSSQKQWKLDICKMDDTLGENESEDNNAKSEKSGGKNTEVSGEAFLDQAKKLKNALDRIEKQINTVEGDLTKKLKNIKYYIGYISSIEDFLPTAE